MRSPPLQHVEKRVIDAFATEQRQKPFKAFIRRVLHAVSFSLAPSVYASMLKGRAKGGAASGTRVSPLLPASARECELPRAESDFMYRNAVTRARARRLLNLRKYPLSLSLLEKGSFCAASP